MFFYDEKKYRPVVTDDEVEKLEKVFEIKILFIAAFSSKVYGYGDDNSDLDFRVFYFNDSKPFIKPIWVNAGNILLEYKFINLKHLLGSYALDEDMKTVMLSDFWEYPEDFYSTRKIFEAVDSDYIWDSGYLIEKVDDLIASIDYMEMLKYYYKRTYDNLRNRLSKDVVSAKNYLKLIIGYGILKCLIEEKVIPNVNIENIIQTYLPNVFKPFSLDIMDKVQNAKVNKPEGAYTVEYHRANKVDIEINRNTDFNDWIIKELSKMESQINKVEESKEKVVLKRGNHAFLFKHLGEYRNANFGGEK